GLLQPQGLAVDSTSVYYTTLDSVYEVPINGGASVLLSSGEDEPVLPFLNSQSLFWVNNLTGDIRTSSKAGGGAWTVMANATWQLTLAVTDNYLYFTGPGDGTVNRMGLTDFVIQTLATNQNFPRIAALDSTDLYYTTNDHALVRVPIQN